MNREDVRRLALNVMRWISFGAVGAGACKRDRMRPQASLVLGAFFALGISAGCSAGEEVAQTYQAAPSHCFVLPGTGSSVTQSYRVMPGGVLERTSEARGGERHMRAAFHPDGRRLYLNSIGPEGWPTQAGDTVRPGVRVLTYEYDPDECRVGAFLGATEMGSGADGQGALALHDQVPVRVVTPADSLADPTTPQILPLTFSLYPGGSHAVVAVHAILRAPGGAEDPRLAYVYPHEFVTYEVRDGGGRLVEQVRMPTLKSPRQGTHHGGTFTSVGGEQFYHSYLTDFDSDAGGALQNLRVGADGALIPLDPPWIDTGLRDGRQPIAVR